MYMYACEIWDVTQLPIQLLFKVKFFVWPSVWRLEAAVLIYFIFYFVIIFIVHTVSTVYGLAVNCHTKLVCWQTDIYTDTETNV